jgi:uncharacterized protein YyaL (SSP411 family)
VPHFEKMLYDQAQLVLANAEAFQITGDPFYSDVALDTLEYVRREMTDPAGGFHSAEDADSVPPEHADDARVHKMEGAFYIWRDEEIGDLLGADAEVFRLHFGVQPGGNAPFDPQEEFTHKNLLYTARTLEEVASQTGRPVAEVTAALRRGRQTLFTARRGRPRPHLDDKVLTAWNGLMIAAFSRTARVVPGAEWALESASRAATFVRERLWDAPTSTLLRRYRQGSAGVQGYAEDYAYLVFGLLELFQTDGDSSWLEWALALQRRQDELFWDADEGGWFSTSGTDPSVLLRMKEEYDGAEPAASSVAAMNLLTLTHLVDDPLLSERLERTLAGFGARAAQQGRAAPMMLAMLSAYHAGIRQVVVVGADAGMRPLLAAAQARYLPSSIVVPVRPQHRERLAALLPWTAAMEAKDGHAAAYVCRDFTCQAPTADAQELQGQLVS